VLRPRSVPLTPSQAMFPELLDARTKRVQCCIIEHLWCRWIRIISLFQFDFVNYMTWMDPFGCFKI
jgi:hypothetical protein